MHVTELTEETPVGCYKCDNVAYIFKSTFSMLGGGINGTAKIRRPFEFQEKVEVTL